MAGTIVADFIRTDANQLSLNVGNTTFATINAMGFLSNTGVQIISPTGAINAASIAAGSIPAGKLGAASVARTNMYSGAVLQVVNSTYTSTFSQSIATRAKLNNISASITPTSATSKILVMCGIFFEGNSADHNWHFFLYRDSTDISSPSPGSKSAAIAMAGLGYFDNDNDSTPATVNFHYFDSPATTSTITYAPGVGTTDGTKTIYINRTVSDIDTIGYERGISSITLMEIAA
jgi:hypothetical protein